MTIIIIITHFSKVIYGRTHRKDTTNYGAIMPRAPIKNLHPTSLESDTRSYQGGGCAPNFVTSVLVDRPEVRRYPIDRAGPPSAMCSSTALQHTVARSIFICDATHQLHGVEWRGIGHYLQRKYAYSIFLLFTQSCLIR